jgi:hypothetical protein
LQNFIGVSAGSGRSVIESEVKLSVARFVAVPFAVVEQIYLAARGREKGSQMNLFGDVNAREFNDVFPPRFKRRGTLQYARAGDKIIGIACRFDAGPIVGAAGFGGESVILLRQV